MIPSRDFERRRALRRCLAPAATVLVGALTVLLGASPALGTPGPAAAARRDAGGSGLAPTALGFLRSAADPAAFVLGNGVRVHAGGLDLAVPGAPGDSDALASFDRPRLLRRVFVGAAPDPSLEPGRALPGRVNLLRGPPESWRSCLRHWAEVRVRGLYPGIDAVHEVSPGGSLKTTYHVAPGADPGRIRLRHEGPHRARVLPDGRLRIDTFGTPVIEDEPIAWQEGPSGRRPIACRWRVRGDGAIDFVLGPHDTGLPLVIDPELAFSTVMEGQHWDVAIDVALQSNGRVVVAGVTRSPDFPVTPGAFDTQNEGSNELDLFVALLEPDASELVYCTLLGGPDQELFGGLVVLPDDGVVVAGSFEGPDFPATPGAFQSPSDSDGVFVTRLSADGSSLDWSAVFGSIVLGDDAGGLVLGPNGDLYMAGRTGDSSFPTTEGVHDREVRLNSTDVFVVELTPDGTTLVRSTLVGETGSARAVALAVAPDGSPIVTGDFRGDDFPTTAGAFQEVPGGGVTDAFVLRLSPDFSELVSSTFVSGTGRDDVHDVHVDRWGNAYVVGETDSPDFPVTAGVFDAVPSGNTEGFVTKVAPDARSLIYSTFLGDDEFANALAVVVDSGGVAHVAGRAWGVDFPTTPDALDPDGGGGTDAFLVSLSPDATDFLYSTLLGGMDNDAAVGLAFDHRGGVYLAGDTRSADFPTTVGVIDDDPSGGLARAAFVSKIRLDCPVERPAPGGAALRVHRPAGTSAGDATAVLDWSRDSQAPRSFEDHYHVLRGPAPRRLARIPGTEPWLELTYEDLAEPSPTVPALTTYEVRVADRCEQEAPLHR